MQEIRNWCWELAEAVTLKRLNELRKENARLRRMLELKEVTLIGGSNCRDPAKWFDGNH